MSDLAARIRGSRQPSARKAGRDPRWPYVPVICTPHPSGVGVLQEQLPGRAFASRAEAVAYAEQAIQRDVDSTRRRLGEPRYRALREQFGLPRELTA